MRRTDPVKHEEKRRAILEAAKVCFLRDGFRGATISEICAEAGISPGHLYHYFASKEAIIGGLTELGLDMAVSSLGQMMESDDAVQALIQTLVSRKMEQSGNGRSLMLEIMSEAGRNPEIAKITEEHVRLLRGLMAGCLRKGQERGQIDPGLDPDVSAAVVLSVINGGTAFLGLDPTLDPVLAKALVGNLISRFLRPQRA